MSTVIDRRTFLKRFGMATPAAILALAAVSEVGIMPKLPRKYGSFDVLEDGTLSLQGQTKFPVYGKDGALMAKSVSYRLLIDGRIECTEYNLLGNLTHVDYKGNILSKRSIQKFEPR